MLAQTDALTLARGQVETQVTIDSCTPAVIAQHDRRPPAELPLGRHVEVRNEAAIMAAPPRTPRDCRHDAIAEGDHDDHTHTWANGP